MEDDELFSAVEEARDALLTARAKCWKLLGQTQMHDQWYDWTQDTISVLLTRDNLLIELLRKASRSD